MKPTPQLLLLIAAAVLVAFHPDPFSSACFLGTVGLFAQREALNSRAAETDLRVKTLREAQDSMEARLAMLEKVTITTGGLQDRLIRIENRTGARNG